MDKNIAEVAFIKSVHVTNFIEQIIYINSNYNLHYNIIMILPESSRNRSWVDLLRNNNIKIVFFPDREKTFRRIKRISSIIKEYKIDVLHLHYGIVTLPAIIAGKLNRKSIIYHCRTTYPISESKLVCLKRKVKFKLLFSNVRVIVLNNKFKRQFSYYGVKPKMISTVPDGIDFKRLANGKSRNEVRSTLGFKKNDLVFFMFGYNIKIKGVDIVLNSFFKIISENRLDIYKNLRLVILVPSISCEAREYILKFVKYKMPEWLVLVEENDNIGEYFRMCDYFISASREEGFSNALAEALYMEKPSIVSDIVGTDWAQKYEIVELFKSENMESFISAMYTIIFNNYSNQISLSVKEDLNNNYSLVNWANKITDLY